MVRLKGVIKLNNKEKGRKVYLNDWLEELNSNIEKMEWKSFQRKSLALYL